MTDKYLSDIELYYSPVKNFDGKKILIDGDEFKHITKVMRHSSGDKLYITDGEGKIYSGSISEINKNSVIIDQEEVRSYKNKLENITFCLPLLKSGDRFEFALEKSIELGLTSFIVFESYRTIPKGAKLERWNKIALSAMKQSLLSYLPKIIYMGLEAIKNLDGEKIILDQNSDKELKELSLKKEKNYFFIFGPEGGLDKKEIDDLSLDKFKIADNRLRTETAVVKCASNLNDIL